MSLIRLSESFKKRGEIHHAVLLKGEKESVTKALLEFLTLELQITLSGNPDFHHNEYISFGIDDGRTLKNFAIQKPLGKYKIFIASFSTMTREAQNALLKIFEDPKENTHFFLITDTTESILPTLKSRLFEIDLSKENSLKKHSKDAKEFMNSDGATRISLLKDLIESKDKQKIYHFLGAIENLLYAETKKSKTKKEALTGLEELAKSKKYLFDTSSSIKLLLEHVALSVPKI